MNIEDFRALVDRALGGDKDAIAALPAAAHRFLAALDMPIRGPAQGQGPRDDT